MSTMRDRPQLWVFAGPNGAGKSTFVARHAVDQKIDVVNPDVIANRIDPSHKGDTAVLMQAGREALSARQRLMSEGRPFAVETTLTGQGELALMHKAREQGYKVNLVYVGLASKWLSDSRVTTRVSKGGHDVPQEGIMRRFDRSMGNLPNAINASDRAFVVDNSGGQYRVLFSHEHGVLRHVSKTLPEWAVQVLDKIDTRDASRHVIQHAARQQTLIVRDGDSFDRGIKGEVVAGSSHHVLVRVSDQVGLVYGRDRLDREVQVGERVSIEPGQQQHRVMAQEQVTAREPGRDQGRER